MSYAHLSQDERYQIQHLRRGGFSVREIAKQIERSPSTVSRELFRNGQADEYAARRAQRQSVLRRQAASSQPRIDATVWPGVEARLTEGWSSEQIAGFGDVAVSHERTYQHIAADRQRGGALWTYLRCRKQRRRHRCGTPRERQRFGGRRIAQRPAIVDTRQRVGIATFMVVTGKATRSSGRDRSAS